MPALPPIPQQSWDDHVETQSQERASAALDAIDQAHAQQQAAQQSFQASEAALESDSQQRAQAQLDAIGQAQQRNDAERASQDQAASMLDAIRAPEIPRMVPSPQQTQGAAAQTGDPLARVYADARANGLDDEGARAAVAVARTEHGYEGATGDQGLARLGSRGTFQFFFGGGQGDEYAKSRGVSPDQAAAELSADPHSGNAYALGGYLGQAIKAGQAQGLHGADLATYAQRVGQRSVSPERAGANYTALQGQSFDQTAAASVLGPPPTPGQDATQFGAARGPSRSEAVGQFDQGLPYDEASAICGPVAALAFAQSTGRNPDLAEARALAKQVGWTSTGGMNGVANEQALLERMGVKSKLDTNPDFGHIAADASSGNPVIISTPIHYYYANAYDPATGKVFVGKTGTSRKGGGSWMTPQEIATLDGGINGALFVDNPQSPTPSVGADPMAAGEGDRPASEFEVPPTAPALPGAYPQRSTTTGPGTAGAAGNGSVLDPFARRLGPDNVQPTDLSRIGIDVPVPGPSEVRAAARRGADVAAAGIDAAGDAITGQIRGFGQDQQEFQDLSRAQFDAARRGETLPPEEEQRLTELSQYGLALTGEPLRGAGGEALGPLERAAPGSYAGGDLPAFMEQKRLDAMRARNAGEVRGPGGADYSRAAEEAYYRQKAQEPPLWQSDWANSLEDPASYGARPPDQGAMEDLVAFHEPEAPAGATRADVLAGLNRGDLLSALKKLNGDVRAGRGADAPGATQGRLSTGMTDLRMPAGPVPEDVAQARYQLPGVLGSGEPPPMPNLGATPLRQRALGGGLGEDLGAIKVPQKVPWIMHALGSQLNVIGAKQNGEFGKQLATMVHDVRDNAATLRGAWMDDAREALALPPAKFANMVDVLESKAAPVDAAVEHAAGATKLVFDEIYNRARQVLPDIKAKIPDYFPHIFDPKEFEGQGYQRAVRHLIDTGQANTIAEAGQLLGQARRYSSDFRKSGNLENAREVDFPFYLKTKDALVQHFTESARRIAEAEQFGPTGALKDKIVAQIAAGGGDARAVDRAFTTAMEQGDPPSELARGVSRGIRAVESAAHLGLSGLSNATQLTNTAAVFGVRRTLRNVGSAMGPEGLREAVRAGVIDPATIANLKEGSGASKALGMVTAPGMGRVEVMNRAVTYHTAIDFANEMARKAATGDRRAIAALDDLGLDAHAVADRGLLTPAEQVRAGRMGVERTQFYVDPQDLPGWASSPAGRIATQFRTFGYQQSKYIGREILTPLVRGDPRPLLKYVAVATALGIPVDTAYDVLSGRGVKTDPKDIALGGLARAGGLGLAGDVYRGAKNIATLPPEMAVARSVGLVGGPFASTVADTIGAAAAAASSLRQKPGSQANPLTPLYRTALGMVPIAGPALQNTLTPYKTRENAPPAPAGPSRSRDSGRTSRDSGRSRGR